MQVDLEQKIADHLERAEALAISAAKDYEESYSSRASALSALTKILNDLEKSQKNIINMKRLSIIEATVVEILKKHLTEEQQSEFLNELETKLGA